jgi:hypothetical protein
MRDSPVSNEGPFHCFDRLMHRKNAFSGEITTANIGRTCRRIRRNFIALVVYIEPIRGRFCSRAVLHDAIRPEMTAVAERWWRSPGEDGICPEMESGEKWDSSVVRRDSAVSAL